jgi:hypothetical protein
MDRADEVQGKPRSATPAERVRGYAVSALVEVHQGANFLTGMSFVAFMLAPPGSRLIVAGVGLALALSTAIRPRRKRGDGERFSDGAGTAIVGVIVLQGALGLPILQYAPSWFGEPLDWFASFISVLV